ncbi:hypothetical protein [Pseudobutyrivibrio sp.]|uniref:hypothetical protein n=1 Tax=Pseudobutyrivibrio sp. TaxID=2014367 RepID=UPI0038637B91
MANPLFEQMNQNSLQNRVADLKRQIQQLKSTGIDPNAKIQELLNNGSVTQEQYNAAVQKAQQFRQFFSN